MKTNMTRTVWGRRAFACIAMLCFGTVHAQSLEIDNQVFQEIEVTAADGSVERQTVPAATVIPGTEVTYVISYRNTGDAPAENVAITNPMPVALEYVGPQGAIPVSEVSVDGGTRFGALTALTVPGADGQPRAAQPADVTHLRWILAALPPGAEGAVSFSARVR